MCQPVLSQDSELVCGAWDKQVVRTPEAAQAARCHPSLTPPATALHSCSLLRPGQQKLGRSKALELLEKFPFFKCHLKKQTLFKD